MKSLMRCAGALCVAAVLGRAGSISPGGGASSSENRQFSNGTNHVSGGRAVPGNRCGAASFFQAAG